MLPGGVSAVRAPIVNPNGDNATQRSDKTVTAMEFSPATVRQNLLVSGSCNGMLHCWEITETGEPFSKSLMMYHSILDVCWSNDATRVFVGSGDNSVKIWDLMSDTSIKLGSHEGPVSICKWVQTPNYACVMTGSWDKTLKFWDRRMTVPFFTAKLPEKIYSADVVYPIAIFNTASKGVVIYNLENKPSIPQYLVSPLQYQHRCIALAKDSVTQSATGFGLGSVNGRAGVFLNYFNSNEDAKEFYKFKCHRHNIQGEHNVQDIYAVNDIKFHPVHGTIATAGSDGTYAFWDKEARKKLMESKNFDKPVTKCCFNCTGEIFAYSTGYAWSQGHAYNDPCNMPQIAITPCFDETKPNQK